MWISRLFGARFSRRRTRVAILARNEFGLAQSDAIGANAILHKRPGVHKMPLRIGGRRSFGAGWRLAHRVD
jgi:hypothetical protein